MSSRGCVTTQKIHACPSHGGMFGRIVLWDMLLHYFLKLPSVFLQQVTALRKFCASSVVPVFVRRSLASWFLKFGVFFRNLSWVTCIIVVACLATASVGWYARDEFWTHLEGRSRDPIWGKVRYEIEGGKEKQEHRHWVRIADLQAEIWTRDRPVSSIIDIHWIATFSTVHLVALICRGVCKIPKGDNYRHIRPYVTSQLPQEGFSWKLIFEFFFRKLLRKYKFH